MAEPALDERIAAVRRFNRFYTQHLKFLNEKYLRSLFSVAEARVIYELARRGSATATELASELYLDPGYASRILRRLGKRGLVDGQPFEKDGRSTLLRLTGKGQETFARLDSRARESVHSLLAGLAEAEQERLVRAMVNIEMLMSPPEQRERRIIVRPHRPGDLGWAVHRHGLLFSNERDWDQSYESRVAARAAEFLTRQDQNRERFLIAELEGEPAGCVMVRAESERVAGLDLLLVDPPARGLGIGTRLVSEAVAFARNAGYGKMALEASHMLSEARRLFQKAGFRVVGKKHVQDFGHYLTIEKWELRL